MNERILKNQVSVFGKFHFPPVPQTTIQLMQTFQAFDLMPSVVNVLDPNTGQVGQRLCLQRGIDSLQIVFSDDRIDVSQMTPTAAMELNAFVEFAHTLLQCMSQQGLRYSRVALVKEIMVDRLSVESTKKMRERLLPLSAENCIEWTARWVDVQTRNDEQYNVCYDVQKLAGIMVFPDRSQHLFDGVKVLFDISTKPEKTDTRFDNGNILPIFSEMHDIYNTQRTYLEL